MRSCPCRGVSRLGSGIYKNDRPDRGESQPQLVVLRLAARGETPAAFGRRCIPPPPQPGCRVGGPGAGCVAPRSNSPGIAPPPRKPRAAGAPVLGRRALPAGRLARLGATPDFHHGLLGACPRNVNTLPERSKRGTTPR